MADVSAQRPSSELDGTQIYEELQIYQNLCGSTRNLAVMCVFSPTGLRLSVPTECLCIVMQGFCYFLAVSIKAMFSSAALDRRVETMDLRCDRFLKTWHFSSQDSSVHVCGCCPAW